MSMKNQEKALGNVRNALKEATEKYGGCRCPSAVKNEHVPATSAAASPGKCCSFVYRS
jgi:hypothetical protein